MPSETCLICATNEGIFLNIFTHDKNLRNNIETCLSIKLFKSKVSSQLICHKCAFEFDKCSNFVKKYKTTARERLSIAHRQRIRYCSLCLEPGKPGYIHNLHIEKSSNALNKIKDIFQDNTALRTNTAICLECRYNLDVLSDLIKIHRATSLSFQDAFDGQEDTKLTEIETIVVKRKTTRIKLSKVQSASKNNVDSSTISLNKSITNRSLSQNPKTRKITSKNEHINSINVSNDTKKCSVFLENILPTKTNSDDLKSKIKAYASLLSDSEQDSKHLSKKTPKLLKRSHNESENKDIINKKIKKEIDEEELPKKRTRTLVKVFDYCESNKPIIKRRISETSITDTPIEKRGRPRKYFKSDSPHSKQTSKSKPKSSVKKLYHENFDSDKNNIKVPVTRIRDKSILSPSSASPSKKWSRKKSDNINNDNEFNNNNGSAIQSYTCSVCLIVYENKVEGLTHELTHFKKLGVILEKVLIPKISDKKFKIIDEQINEKEKQDVSSENISGLNSFVDDHNKSEILIEKLDGTIHSINGEALTMLGDGTIIEQSTDKGNVSKSLEKPKKLTVINDVSGNECKNQNNDIDNSDVIFHENVQNKNDSSHDIQEIAGHTITENVGEKKIDEFETTDTRNIEAQMEKIHEDNNENRKAETKINNDNPVNSDTSQFPKSSKLPVKEANSVELSEKTSDENSSIIEANQKTQNNIKHISSLGKTSNERDENKSVETNHKLDINNTESSLTEVSVQLNNSQNLNEIETEQSTIPKFDEVNSIENKKTIENKLLDLKVNISENNHVKTNDEKSQENQIDSNNEKIEMISNICNDKLKWPEKTSIYQDISDDENFSDVKINADKSILN